MQASMWHSITIILQEKITHSVSGQRGDPPQSDPGQQTKVIPRLYFHLTNNQAARTF
jgi:hypothetical protein